jgi:hypothetical protein
MDRGLINLNREIKNKSASQITIFTITHELPLESSGALFIFVAANLRPNETQAHFLSLPKRLLHLFSVFVVASFPAVLPL